MQSLNQTDLIYFIVYVDKMTQMGNLLVASLILIFFTFKQCDIDILTFLDLQYLVIELHNPTICQLNHFDLSNSIYLTDFLKK